MKSQRYTTGYLSQIEYLTKEINELAFSLQYGNPKYVGGLSTKINNRLKRLEYFLNRHCQDNGGIVGVV